MTNGKMITDIKYHLTMFESLLTEFLLLGQFKVQNEQDLNPETVDL
jgi:hypothetical protein